MTFTSYWFAVFAAIFFTSFYLAPYPILRYIILLAGSIVFHGHFAGPSGVLPVIILGVVTYAAALTGKRSVIISAIAANAAALIFYKYTIFLSTSLIGIFSADYAEMAKEFARSRLLPATPPLAISFFVFEFVHYLVDVMHGQKTIRGPFKFTLFGIFWPSVVAGPLKRYEQFLPSVERAISRRADADDVIWGAVRVMIGFLKKVAADNMTIWITAFDAQFTVLPIGDRWLMFLAIGFRILLDFSGYSDMAIGFARMMGVRLPENFNWPYIATSPIEFWRRWHITLSTWIRDYIYIPLGGGRVPVLRRIFNALVAFALCGLWHGAGWNFAVWGIYHGIGVALTTVLFIYCGERFSRTSALIRYPVAAIGWAATMIFVFVGWLPFFYPLGRSMEMLASLLSTVPLP